MKKKIIAAIAAYLENETNHCNGFGRGEWIEFGGSLNPAGVDHAGFCQEIAAEIAAAIAPLVEAGDVDDSQYTDDFLKWREKYFSKAKPETKQFVSKNMGVYFSHLELESKYERAMNGFKAKK